MSVKRSKSRVADKLAIALDSIGGKVLKVGWVTGKQYPDSKMTTAEVGYISEHGSPKNNIPPRPIIRPTMIREEKTWRKIATVESKKVLQGSTTAAGSLERLGLAAAGDMRTTITKITTPPLKRATVLARTRTYAETIKIDKSSTKEERAKRKAQIKKQLSVKEISKPLVFTKILLNSVTHSVESE